MPRAAGWLLLAASWLIVPADATASVVGEVRIASIPSGYEIQLSSTLPLQYQRHAPQRRGRVLRIWLRPIGLKLLKEEGAALLREHSAIGWDTSTGIPLQAITYDGGDLNHPVITLTFSRDVAWEVQAGTPLGVIRMTVDAQRPELVKLLRQADAAMAAGRSRQAVELYARVGREAEGELKRRAQASLERLVAQDVQQARSRAAKRAPPIVKPAVPKRPRAVTKTFRSADAAMAAELYAAVVAVAQGPLQQRATAVERDLRTATAAGPVTDHAARSPAHPEAVLEAGDPVQLMRAADGAMAAGNERRAAELYAAVVASAQGTQLQQAQERLGLAYDRSGQPARARAEYERYLRAYPEGPDADRVRQRLAGIMTATKAPKAKLAGAAVHPKPKWEARHSGSLSQLYTWNELDLQRGGTRVVRSDLTTNLQLHTRLRSENMEIQSQVAGSHRDTFLSRAHDEDRMNTALMEVRDTLHHWGGKVGRQSQASSGVLGRFDGIRASYDVTPTLAFNSVFGSPVETPREMNVNTDRSFYGFSVDVGPFLGPWEVSGFFIDQANEGRVDRRALGGELRRFTPTSSLFYLVDYDIFFGVMNATALNGRLTFPTETTLGLGLDYRRSPSLTTHNAIQGQQATELSDVIDRFSDETLYALAEDRTAISTSASLSLAQSLTKKVQLMGEALMSELEGTIASGGVDAVPGTGREYFYSTQLVLSDLLLEQDLTTVELRYATTMQNNRYALHFGYRLPFVRKIWFTPKCLLEYRGGRDGRSRRVTTRPSLRFEYALWKWCRLETELGAEWRDQTVGGVSDDSLELFLTTGSRLTF